MRRETLWALVGTSSALVAGFAARRSLMRGWKTVTDRDPPLNPAAPEVHWREAMIWTATAGAVVGVVRMLARRGAASAFGRLSGKVPKSRT